ncbi:glycosyl transferase [Serinibacter arcticus]|uniref:Glycosyl transferase n=1 Tax=Serinibacter arcticus TaxID=1655435 RepID=A0A2U1ZYP4_9MICO|nr:glycosyltransferase [Serinibacter arcticus]PWD52107.1 glycosyl transferase [Serinibacter arcticus]
MTTTTETPVEDPRGAEVVLVPEGHRVLQRVILPPDAESDSLVLYVEQGIRLSTQTSGSDDDAHVDSSGVERVSTRDVNGRFSIRIRSGQRTSFGTYFNGFAASYWKKWTTLSSVRLAVDISGAANVIIYRSNARGAQQRVGSKAVHGRGVVEFQLPLKQFGDGGWYWFDVEAAGKGALVHSAVWTAPAELAPRRGSLSLGMTTLNKTDDVLRNIATVAGDADLRELLDEMIIVDQGSDRLIATEGFDALAAQMGEQLQIVEQGNIGGSGGFSRGMYEVVTRGKSDYVLLMDDDIDVEPESLIRMVTFADFAKRPTLVGAHMFDLNNRSVLHTYGERVDPWRVQPVVAHDDLHMGHDFAASGLRSTSWLHRRADVDYNGWWSTLIPVEVVRELGLSLPIFIKWDDAEYGLRAKAAGYPTVSLPGAGVWHMSWIDKDDLVGWQAYFHTKNRLIVALLYSQYANGGGAFKEAIMSDVKHLLSMQYYTQAGRIRGLRDLLKGPGALHGQIGTVLPEIRGMAKQFDDAVYKSDADEFPAVDRGKPKNKGRGLRPPSIRSLVPFTARTTLRQLAEPLSDRAKTAPQDEIAFQDARWWRLAQYDSALVTNADGTGVAWYRRNPAKLRAQLAEVAMLHVELQRRWSSLSTEYRDALADLTSFEAWEKTFADNPSQHRD